MYRQIIEFYDTHNILQANLSNIETILTGFLERLANISFGHDLPGCADDNPPRTKNRVLDILQLEQKEVISKVHASAEPHTYQQVIEVLLPLLHTITKN